MTPLLLALALAAGGLSRATFAGGCFWCMEPPFDKVPGVVSTTSGYAGGTVANPKYEDVARGVTGHAEVVQVVFDPQRVSYPQLLAVFWRNIDPFDAGGQFCDRGTPYRAAIFYDGEDQKAAALATRDALQKQSGPAGRITTEIVPLATFYRAEDDHQDYARRKVREYFIYRTRCGRDERLRQLWGKPEP